MPRTPPCPPHPPTLQYSFQLHFGFSGLFAADSLRLCFETQEQVGRTGGQAQQRVVRRWAPGMP